MSKKESTTVVRPIHVTSKSVLTVSQLINLFENWLPHPGNYPRLTRQFIQFCLANSLPITQATLQIYGEGKTGNKISPIKKFFMFFQVIGFPKVVADPPAQKPIPANASFLIDRYLQEAVHLMGEKTKDNYTQALTVFFKFMHEERAAGKHVTFTTQTVHHYIQHLKKKGLSAFTINFYLSSVKQLGVWVVENAGRLGLNEEQINALQGIKKIKGIPVERKFHKDSLTAEERDGFLRTIDDPLDKAVAMLMVTEGLRTVEVTRLTIGDLDFDKEKISVLGRGKADKKTIDLFPECAQAIRNYLNASGIAEGGCPAPSPDQLLFPGLTTGQIRYRIDRYLKAMNLKRKNISAHSLRHTAGQILIDEGVDPTWVQQHLRHELFETTLLYIKKQDEVSADGHL
ncbi:tyrosine-type recombinase/integrase [Arsenicibacter rosenii]|uniref:Tyr recombinase domain-containing protein n=1 Tax=Arsenicibacter rosenii TaxID=1750698 RepID=A0A1S2VBJ5_9BACT|nr:tyrosine-type recombinase/integrase [Arsenicibacter rosenii]OIN55586.1 hypothetical protein BLX24_29305 [Arsenicibacter rosenii]